MRWKRLCSWQWGTVKLRRLHFPLVNPAEREIYETGDQINRTLSAFIKEGILSGEFQPDIPVLPTVFLFWGSLSGLIRMAADKESYFQKALDYSREQFLEFGFERLYRLIAAEDPA